VRLLILAARDIQVLEMNPLGPLNGKSAGTSISPWIVTADALEPFRVAGTQQNDRPAPYLQPKDELNHYAVNLQVDLTVGSSSTTVCKSRLDWLYWGFRDMIAHQTINGCCVNSGDMLATGTVSGSDQGTNGCLFEVTGGKRPLKIADGKERLYLEDGDGVRLNGWAGELGSDACVGFGDCFGVLEPAIQWTK
jgi:fumarylacetoacetase